MILAGLLTVFVLYAFAVSFDVIPRSSNLGMNLLVAIDDDRDWSLSGYTEQEKSQPLLTYLSFALEHPGDYFRQRAQAIWDLWGPWPSAGGEHASRSPVRRALIGLRFPLLLLGVFGWIRNSKRPEAWILIVPVLSITLIHTAFFAESRFSYPVEPLLTILAVWGLASCFTRSKNAKLSA